MQDSSSVPLPKNLLTDEIEEAGNKIARLVQPNSSLDRVRRREIRAFLKEAFQSTQEECSIDKLTGILERLRQILKELGDSPTRELEQRVSRHDRFGVADDRLADRGKDFVDHINQSAEKIAQNIQTRMNPKLKIEGGNDQGSGRRRGIREPRPLNTGQELMEYVTKKQG